ncbi:TetR family transcriptional regulator [Stutzerimonas kirkiae]|uniref:TetR family transcriptional regulator n=1 Tax=Stutzerimonas kirkiae TaxID=2211392 RepID=A0A4Q9R8J1_9GAMM|nr:TetR/AcrR family transcriptional regulator [Stutzerimonas kirkiae]TBU96249.1 TetR family transcriptional regulator [Stutzerimonas kirkiae]TBV03408.1 TetR family transcriptional regulator [Stutzerimonas kirkiae]
MPQSSPTDRHDKSLSILEAATSVFLTHGFSAATTDMIQRESGVSKATLYSLFPGKEAMFTAVIERQCARMASTIQAIRTAPGDIARTLTDIATAYLDIVLSDSGLALFRVVVAESPRFPTAGRCFYLAGPRTVTSMVAEHLSEAAQAREIDIHPLGVEAAASLFISLVRAEGQLECLMHPSARPSAEQMERWVRQAVDVFLGRFGAHTTNA